MKILTARACERDTSDIRGGRVYSLNLLAVYGRPVGLHYWTASQVVSVLRCMQDTGFLLGFADDLTVALPALRLFSEYDPKSGAMEAQMDGRLDILRRVLVVGEMNPAFGLAHLLGHELGHVIWRRYVRQDDASDTPALREFCRLTGIDPADYPEDSPTWQLRLRELAAEWIAQALWSVGPRSVFPPLDWQQRTALRSWITTLWPQQTRATFTIEDLDLKLPHVHIYPDGTTLVDGMGVMWPPDQRPVLIEGRFFMSLRQIMEQVVNRLVEPYGLRAGIYWDYDEGRAVPFVRQR